MINPIRIRLCVPLVSLLIVSTGGLAAGGQHGHHGNYQGGEGKHRHSHDFPPVMHRFHNVMAPLVHSQPGEARMQAICDSADQLGETAKAVVATPAPTGREQAWTSAAGQLNETSQAIGADCDDGGFEAEVLLGRLHQAFHGLIQAAR